MAQPDPGPRPLRIAGGDPASAGADDASHLLFASAKDARISQLDRALSQLGSQMQDALEAGAARIGNATVVGRVGEGTYGEVFVAISDPPLSRRIAVKILKRGLETRAIITRFSREQRALSRIDHPVVVPILESGETGDGRPWFSMPLLEGSHLTTACDDAGMGLRDRLSLFARVCDGVHAAHVQGIVHRDLKPGNILVVGRPPEPRIIDFGIARAADEERDATQTVEGDRRRLGTLAYMAPEQLELGAGADARSDVYSLGIILDELVTGIRPKAAGDRSTATGVRPLVSRALMAALILGEPSASRFRAAQARGFDGTAAHARALRGDIDAIVAKATMPEPGLRYQSAEALADDVRRWHRREPVSAHAPTRRYIASRFIRRNPWATASIALAVLALGSIAALAYSRAVQAERSAQLAVAAADQARAVNQVLATVLRGISPGVARGRDPQLMVEAIDGAAAAFSADLVSQSDLVTGEVARTLSQAYIELEQPEKAIALLTPALEQLAGRAGGDVTRLLRARLLVQLGAAQAAERRLSRVVQSADGLMDAVAPYADALDEFAALGRLDDPDSVRAAVELWGNRVTWPGRTVEDGAALAELTAFGQMVERLVETLPTDDPVRWRYRLRAVEVGDFNSILAQYPGLVAELGMQRRPDDPELLRARTRLLQFEVGATVEGRNADEGPEPAKVPRMTDLELAAKWRELAAMGETLVADNERSLGATHNWTLTARLWHAHAAGFDARWQWIAKAHDADGRAARIDASFEPPPEIRALFDDLARDLEAVDGRESLRAEEAQLGLAAVRGGERLRAWWRPAPR